MTGISCEILGDVRFPRMLLYIIAVLRMSCGWGLRKSARTLARECACVCMCTMTLMRGNVKIFGPPVQMVRNNYTVLPFQKHLDYFNFHVQPLYSKQYIRVKYTSVLILAVFK